MAFIKNLLSILLGLMLLGCGRPMAEFNTPKEKLIAPTEVAFENKSKKAESYLWNFGDGRSYAYT
jgi:PKD repeat protein